MDRRRLGTRHPRRQQRQGAVRLTNDQVIDARVPLGADYLNKLIMLRVKGISDDYLGRQIPGSMTLFRQEPARPISPSPSPSRAPASAMALAAASSTSSMSADI
jgi:hypothetical protein